MRRAFRYAFAVLAWLFVVGIVVQTFYAGLPLFSRGSDFEVHIGLGWTLHLVPILLVVVAAIARAGRGTIWWTVGLLAAVLPQPFLPGLRESAPILAALHPVNALLIFGLALVVALRSLAPLRAEATPAQPAPSGPA
jgi:Family of unknown function (DUF6220)